MACLKCGGPTGRLISSRPEREYRACYTCGAVHQLEVDPAPEEPEPQHFNLILKVAFEALADDSVLELIYPRLGKDYETLYDLKERLQKEIDPAPEESPPVDWLEDWPVDEPLPIDLTVFDTPGPSLN